MLHKKSPNYLKFILLALAIIMALYLIVGFFLASNAPLAMLPPSIANNLIDNNLVTFLKENTIITPQIYSDSPVLGATNAKVTIFEFSSFKCPLSAEAQKTINEVLKKYPNDVKLVWKDLPLEETYPGAELAHLAARCAQQQNKFWEYADLLWQNQNDLSEKNLSTLAKKIKLNQTQFSACLKDKNTEALIQKDLTEAGALLIPGTPHFYINNQELMGNFSFEEFERLIEVELNRK